LAFGIGVELVALHAVAAGFFLCAKGSGISAIGLKFKGDLAGIPAGSLAVYEPLGALPLTGELGVGAFAAGEEEE